jgi:hypothetical protein
MMLVTGVVMNRLINVPAHTSMIWPEGIRQILPKRLGEDGQE